MEPTIYEQRRQALTGLHFLPLFYLIPNEIADKRGLAYFPRDPYIATTDEHWQEVYHSKLLGVTLMDTWGWMMWQCLGINTDLLASYPQGTELPFLSMEQNALPLSQRAHLYTTRMWYRALCRGRFAPIGTKENERN